MSGDKSNKFSYSNAFDDFWARCEHLRPHIDGEVCCVAVDIEHFRLFNEMYGWERGNDLLEAYVEVLGEFEIAEDYAFTYIGHDDFVIFMSYDPDRISIILQKLKDATLSLENTVGFLPAIGIYRLRDGEDISFQVYDHAVSASENAKKVHSGRICEFDIDQYERERKESEVLKSLKVAMDEDLITFYLQPQCRISTGKIVGTEALARWITKDGRVISPGCYIPVLEKKGVIADFDKIIWEKVVSWLREMIISGVMPVPVSINVSQVDIFTMDVAEYLLNLCNEYCVPTSLIKVEITESSYAAEFDKIQQFVKDIKSKGFLVMMDDFGSGYSSLNMLENISVDALKLDMNFIKNSNIKTRKGITIIESIINMAKMMALPIIVEGVETEDQIRFLTNLGCRYAQGYYFHKPMSIVAYEELISQDDILDFQGLVGKMNEEIHVREFLDENTFTDAVLNNILGAVAFYSLDGRDLTITRFNEKFYEQISDALMTSRQKCIQNYVVREDWGALYKALDDAYENVANGASCEIRFYKSDDSVFWFRMKFFYLRNEDDKRIYYGQVMDITEMREQSSQFFEVLRNNAVVTMMVNLNEATVQYVTGTNRINQIGIPSIPLSMSLERTIESRIRKEADKDKFRKFFNVDRLKEAHKKARYHENLDVEFRMTDKYEMIRFSTYYMRYSIDQELTVYIFGRKISE